VNGSGFGDVLTGSSEANVIKGGGGGDQIFGESGEDFLFGSTGADRTDGGNGNDTHFVDAVGDVARERIGEGEADRVVASLSYTLAKGDEIELLTTNAIGGTAAIALTGNEFANAVTGNGGANALRGLAGDDALNGQAGDDLLVGGAGADHSSGGLGDDRHIVDNAADRVTERAGEGRDTVIAGVDYALGLSGEIELLRAADAAATAPLKLTGNNKANEVIGNQGANILGGRGGSDVLTGLGGDDELNGGTGADRTVGGAGNDFHFVDHAGDVVVELAGEGDADRLLTSVDYRLGESVRIEILAASGTASIDLTGNSFANRITGNDAGNLIAGGGGNDVLRGLGGGDAFLFDTALIGAGNIDQILDFSSDNDIIRLDAHMFEGLAEGALAEGAFRAGRTALQADDRILYDQASGALFFDADGSRDEAAAVRFATLQPGTELSAAEFLVVA
jgi:Ca2+-binding RTX toxin-like protein